MNPQRLSLSLSPRSLRTRFAIRFLRALRKINTRKCRFSAVTKRSSYHKVKTAADASMASVVGTRRVWSRAMLLKLRWRRSRNIRLRAPVILVGGKRLRKKKKKIQNHQLNSAGQEENLRKLIPGGEVMDAYSLLDETAHYIKCLTAQVMVMRSIVNYCST